MEKLTCFMEKLFLNISGHQVSFGLGWGFQDVAYPSGHSQAEEGGRHSGINPISYQKTKILNNHFAIYFLKNIKSLSIKSFEQDRFYRSLDSYDDIEDYYSDYSIDDDIEKMFIHGFNPSIIFCFEIYQIQIFYNIIEL